MQSETFQNQNAIALEDDANSRAAAEVASNDAARGDAAWQNAAAPIGSKRDAESPMQNTTPNEDANPGGAAAATSAAPRQNGAAISMEEESEPQKEIAAPPSAVASTRNAATLENAPSEKTVSPEVAAMLRDERVAALAMQARSTLRRGNRDEARKLLQQMFALSPTDAGALELLGDIFLEEGEQEKAIAVFERGRKHHPNHAAFEEKIALARIDQQEEELTKIRRELALQGGDTESWQDKKPNLAALLSLVLPGAGHVYLEKYERAAAYFGSWLATFLGWYLPLHAALPTEAASAALRQSRSFLAPFAAALGNLEGFWKLLFWTMLLLNLGVYVVSAFEAAKSAKADAQARKRELGL